MHVVWCDDGNEVHALVRRQGSFSADHFLEIPVAALGGKEEISATDLGFFRIGGECATDEFRLLIDCRCDAMNAADESATSAADHAITNFSAHKIAVLRCVGWSEK